MCKELSLVVCLALLAGCVDETSTPTPLPTGVSRVESPVETNAGESPQAEKPAAGQEGLLDAPKALKLSRGVSFTAPAGWRQVPVKGNIPEAEFALPAVEGDEHDGRLTLMSALGGLEENTKRWKSEFTDPGEPKVDTIKLGNVEATIVDIRGEWKGTSFRPISPPRADHRLIAVYVPLGGADAYYVKLTGPKATLEKRDEEIQKFIKSCTVDKAAE